MHSQDRRFTASAGKRIAAFAAIVALVVCCAPATAGADGDPASDVLVSQPTFLPWDAGASARQQSELADVARAAARSGVQIRVAVIASPSDMGSVTALWHQPQSYAQFLGQELSLVYGGRLLVVMPGGFGLYQPGRPTAAERAALGRVTPPATGAGAVTAAIAAIQGIAAASGHALPLSSTSAPSGATGSSSSGDTVAWIVFLLGAGLIAVAWVGSVRARPLHPGG